MCQALTLAGGELSSLSFGIGRSWALAQVLPISNGVMLGNSLNLSEPQSPHL